jgi:predicted TIM-barrel fold metal-dependent hydrolase
MIIDAETHPIGVKRDGTVENRCYDLLKWMDANSIDVACIMGAAVALGEGHSWNYSRNAPGKAIEQAVKENPSRLVGFCRFFYENPVQPNGWIGERERALKEFEEMLSSGVFKGVGEVNFLETGSDDAKNSFKEYIPFMEIASKYRVPIEFHTGMSGTRPLSYYEPILVDELASRYPDVTFLINHCAFMMPPYDDQCLYIAAKNPNVQLEIAPEWLVNTQAGTEIFKRFVRKALGAYNVGAGRLIFGTSWNYGQYEHNSLAWKTIREIEMSEVERAAITGENMKRLIRL